ncbi:hypothetical protein AB0442_18130 [Kitasatospora sp. NPDC085895]|uniref:hypothetical protein n=1 Tax=Kitasatospora sp. NPDC085895 TaxID=3155057 RepID=UPI00344E7396
MTAAEVTSEIPVVLTGFTTRVRRRVTDTVRRRVCQGPGSLSVQPSDVDSVADGVAAEEAGEHRQQRVGERAQVEPAGRSDRVTHPRLDGDRIRGQQVGGLGHPDALLGGALRGIRRRPTCSALWAAFGVGPSRPQPP